ncbi:hypothetical protein RGQ29_015611 [Quercus rubra]|uniref:Protein kinase domain-containing protein n=1 Tax=Quercus rubra TaxID=3512 RepID=A0AAN7FTD0_QUERU|nr:hypothetical protein RGQ29_015611 [Quercus rubra]
MEEGTNSFSEENLPGKGGFGRVYTGTLQSGEELGMQKWTEPTRLKVALGAAKGLAYLHSSSSVGIPIVHRDFKSTNVLLNANFEAKIFELFFPMMWVFEIFDKCKNLNHLIMNYELFFILFLVQIIIFIYFRALLFLFLEI